MYEVDATKLAESFADSKKFDRVVWLFPHVPGKQNIKRNRLLLQNFFASAAQVLSPGGAVVLALAEGQSGFTDLQSNQDWLHSWKLSAAAGEAGLLVTCRRVFDVEGLSEHGYSPAGHRGSGGSFPTRRAELFLLERPGADGDGARAIQAPVFVFEIHLLGAQMQDAQKLEADCRRSVNDLLGAHALPQALWSVNMVDLYIEPKTRQVSHTLQIAIASTVHAVGRTAADDMRALIERELPARLGLELRQEKAGGSVSKPHCWPIALALQKGGAPPAAPSNCDAEQLNQALRALEPGSNPALANAESNAVFTQAHHDETWGAQAEEIRAVARRLWRQRVGVLIHAVGGAGRPSNL